MAPTPSGPGVNVYCEHVVLNSEVNGAAPFSLLLEMAGFEENV